MPVDGYPPRRAESHHRTVAGCREAYEHDLVAKASEVTAPSRIRHVPQVLYHRRAASLDPAAGQAAESSSGMRTVIDGHLTRLGIAADVSTESIVRVRYRLPTRRHWCPRSSPHEIRPFAPGLIASLSSARTTLTWKSSSSDTERRARLGRLSEAARGRLANQGDSVVRGLQFLGHQQPGCPPRLRKRHRAAQ